MKQFALVLLLVSACMPIGFSAESIAIDSISSLQAESTSSFSMIVTRDGKLIAKPGSLFTKGGNYEGIQLPYLLSTPKPIAYPAWAIKESWEGRFAIAIEVLTDGSVGRYKVMESTGNATLDKTATQAVLSWKFHPAIKDGKPIRECIQIPVIFQLSSE